MRIQIGELPTDIHPNDTFNLRLMAHAVLQDRPSFRHIAGSVGGEAVSIFTRRRHRQNDVGEELVIKGTKKHLRFRTCDHKALERLLHDMG